MEKRHSVVASDKKNLIFGASPSIPSHGNPNIKRKSVVSKTIQLKPSNKLGNIHEEGISKAPAPKPHHPTIETVERSKNKKLSAMNIGAHKIMEPEKIDYSHYKEIEGQPKVFGETQGGTDDYGERKTNQDSYVLLENILNLNNFSVLGIFDGHGTNGHFVSSFIKERFNKFFSDKNNFVSKSEPNISPELVYNKLTKNDHSVIKNLIKDTEEKIFKNKSFDSHFSGSTCNAVIIGNNITITLNIGDSRSILVKMDSNKNFTVEQMSIDHKPSIETEKERINSKGGLIETAPDDKEGPLRIWVKNSDYPGMCVSRSIGDEIHQSVGVISDPEIFERKIDETNAFIVCASDGVWEYLSNEKVMEIVTPFFFEGDEKGAVKEIISQATKCWINDGLARDDITCIVYFFKSFKKN